MQAIVTTRASEELGKLVLRITLGILILLHGIAKLTGGIGHIVGILEGIGMPAAFGYLVFVGEVLAPILVIIGLWTRLGALLIAINMVVAIWLVHMGELLQIGKTGGWALELQGMFLFTAIAVMLLGAGRYSIGGYGGRWN